MAHKTRLNREITAPEVRLVDLEGNQAGVVSLQEALERAEAAGYDLVEIAPNAKPPVVKILDWGKYRYEQTKQIQKSRKNQKQVEIKQVRFGLKIGDHDFNVKLDRARKFLESGHKVKISVLFRGREITHPDLGLAIISRVIEALSDIAEVEQTNPLSGREISTVIGSKKDAKTQNS